MPSYDYHQWPKPCRDCGRDMWPSAWRRGRQETHCGRGLCNRCYDIRTYNGTLIDVARITRSRDDVLDDWVILRRQGHTRQQAAERLGFSDDALAKHLRLARRDGDPRAAAA